MNVVGSVCDLITEIDKDRVIIRPAVCRRRGRNEAVLDRLFEATAETARPPIWGIRKLILESQLDGGEGLTFTHDHQLVVEPRVQQAMERSVPAALDIGRDAGGEGAGRRPSRTGLGT